MHHRAPKYNIKAIVDNMINMKDRINSKLRSHLYEDNNNNDLDDTIFETIKYLDMLEDVFDEFMNIFDSLLVFGCSEAKALDDVSEENDLLRDNIRKQNLLISIIRDSINYHHKMFKLKIELCNIPDDISHDIYEANDKLLEIVNLIDSNKLEEK